MIITLPGSPAVDIASSTTSALTPYIPIVVLGGGLFLGLFVIQFLFDMLADRYYPQRPAEHPPQM